MDSNKNAYCRFCAEPKSSDKLLNLQTDGNKHGEVTYKLTFLNANYVNVSNQDSLPKTICFVCYDLLNKSYNFLNGVKRAQGILTSIFTTGEANNCDISDDDIGDDFLNSDVPEDLPDIKQELQTNIHDQSSSTSLLFKRTKRKKHQNLNLEEVNTDFLSPSPETSIKTELNHLNDSKTEPDFTLDVKTEPKDTKEFENSYTNSLYVHELLDAALSNNFNSDVTIYAKEVSEFTKRDINTWADYPWVCLYCSIEFISQDMLSTHAKLVHGKCSAFYCIDCKCGRKDDFVAFIKHVRKHRKVLR